MKENIKKEIIDRLHVIHNIANIMTTYTNAVNTNNILNYNKLFTFSISDAAIKSLEKLNSMTLSDVKEYKLDGYDGEFDYSSFEDDILKKGTSSIIGSYGKDEFQRIIQDVLANGIESMYDDDRVSKEIYLIVISLFIIHLRKFDDFKELSRVRTYLIGIYVNTNNRYFDDNANDLLTRDILYSDDDFVLLNTSNVKELNNVEEIMINSIGNEKYIELWDKYLISSNNTNNDLNERLKESIEKEVKNIKDYGIAIDNIDKLLSISIDDVAMCRTHHSKLLFVTGILEDESLNKALVTIELYNYCVDVLKLGEYSKDGDEFELPFDSVYMHVDKCEFNLPTIELSPTCNSCVTTTTHMDDCDEEYLDTLTVDTISVINVFLAKFRDQKISDKVKEIFEREYESNHIPIDEILDTVVQYKLNFDECKEGISYFKILDESKQVGDTNYANLYSLDYLENILIDAVDSFNSIGFPIRSEMMFEQILEDVESKEIKDEYLSSLIEYFNKPNI